LAQRVGADVISAENPVVSSLRSRASAVNLEQHIRLSEYISTKGEIHMAHRGHLVSRLLLAMLAAAALLLIGVNVVAAAPDNKNTFEFDVTCPDAGGALTLTEIDANGVARWIQGSTSTFILVSVVGELTVEGETFPVSFLTPESRAKHQEFTTCYANDTATRPKTGQTATLVATVRAIITPRQH
jgi:hypothetical protein